MPGEGTDGIEPVQNLYRMRYSGPEGDGSLKLVVRLESWHRFTVEASDTFGRRVWELDVRGADALWVEHRQRTYCELTAEEIVLEQLAIGPLSARSIARLLLGRSPVELDLPSAGAFDLTDSTGRRWTGRVEPGERSDTRELEQWTLWRQGEPQVWWSREGSGGVLSSRDGAQARWRLQLSERLAEGVDGNAMESPGAGPEPAIPPADYLEVSCHDDSPA